MLCLSILLFSCVCESVSGISLVLGGAANAVLGQSHTLHCTVSPNSSISLAVPFLRKRETDFQPVCTVLTSCRQLGTVQDYSCGCYRDSGGERVYNLTIHSARLIDDTDWKCQYSTDPSNSFRLQVFYAPDVKVTSQATREGNRMTVTCEACGRPNSYTFHGFQHNWGDQPVRKVEGIKEETNKYVWTVSSASYQDSGTYQCSVDNGIPNRNNTVIQTNTTSVLVKGIPVITLESKSDDKVGGEAGHPVILYKTVFSQGLITKYSWMRNNFILSDSLIETTNITLNLFENVLVYDKGYNLTLKINSFQESDVGQYRLEICNDVGCGTFSTNLSAVGPPYTPTSFSAYDSTADTVLLRWVADFPGGPYTQRFLVEYKQIGTESWMQRWYNGYAERNEDVYLNITGLKPGQIYVFRVLSENTRSYNNHSPFTSEVTRKTKVLDISTTDLPTSSGLSVGGGIGVGMAVGIAVGIIIGIAITSLTFFRRHGFVLSSSKPADGQQAESDVYQNITPENISPESHHELTNINEQTNAYEGLGPREPTPYAELEIHRTTKK